MKETVIAKGQRSVRNIVCSEDHKCFGKAAMKIEEGKLQKARPKTF